MDSISSTVHLESYLAYDSQIDHLPEDILADCSFSPTPSIAANSYYFSNPQWSRAYFDSCHCNEAFTDWKKLAQWNGCVQWTRSAFFCYFIVSSQLEPDHLLEPKDTVLWTCANPLFFVTTSQLCRTIQFPFKEEDGCLMHWMNGQASPWPRQKRSAMCSQRHRSRQ